MRRVVAGAFALLLSVGSTGEVAALPHVTASVSPAVIRIGDTVAVAITLDPGADLAADWNPPEKLGAFEAIGLQRPERIPPTGPMTMTLYVTSFETGDRMLPAITIPVRAGSGVDSVRTVPYRVTIKSVLPADTTKVDSLTIRAAHAPIDLPQKFRWGVLFGYLVAIALLVFGVRWLLKRLKRRPVVVPAILPIAVPERPAESVALEELEALAAKSYPVRGLFKEHYSEALDIVRHFIEKRLGIEALDRTSWELLEALASDGQAPDLRERMAAMLEEADLVKFAKQTPTVETSATLLESARHWVKSVHADALRRETERAVAAAATAGKAS